ncbi:sialidase-3-like isoform X1 [Clarias gariepinus]|uniref:sialidase-3-like isoform X1 n=1 Tax=Clarias gariepinus TaxID=13013 RepID=UPI00234E04A6|nr:sialidase-3-like isoform X1 [Clarias gariepinus]
MGNTSSTSSHTLSVKLPKTCVFTNTNTEYYRIPALIYIEDGDTQTVLAFAEKRKSQKDVDAKCLVIRRKTQQQDDQWEDVKEIEEASMVGYRTMNPCPVYEKQTKTVFLFFNCVSENVTEQQQINDCKNAACLCYVKSTDRGQTWKDFTDLTKSVIGDEIKNWATFSVGPGHGIQMTNGRLIIPAYAYFIGSSCCCRPKSHSFAFYSDDRGDTWKYGNRISDESGECEMAEITDGFLYCNARRSKCCNWFNCCFRVEAWSQNNGIDFSMSTSCLCPCNVKLVETRGGCQGSVVSFKHGDKTWLLYSHPTDSSKRKDLGVYVNTSPSSSSGWNKPHIINSGVSGYSDLTQISDTEDVFACLLERGNSKVEEIAFVKFTLKDIMPNN